MIGQIFFIRGLVVGVLDKENFNEVFSYGKSQERLLFQFSIKYRLSTDDFRNGRLSS